MDPTPTPTPEPPKSWFGRLSPEMRAMLVLIASAAFAVGWGKLFPGVPVPPLPVPPQSPLVLVIHTGPADHPVSVTGK